MIVIPSTARNGATGSRKDSHIGADRPASRNLFMRYRCVVRRLLSVRFALLGLMRCLCAIGALLGYMSVRVCVVGFDVFMRYRCAVRLLLQFRVCVVGVDAMCMRYRCVVRLLLSLGVT